MAQLPETLVALFAEVHEGIRGDVWYEVLEWFEGEALEAGAMQDALAYVRAQTASWSDEDLVVSDWDLENPVMPLGRSAYFESAGEEALRQVFEVAPGVRRVVIEEAEGLASLEPFAGLSELRALELWECRELMDTRALERLTGLETLRIHGAWDLPELVGLGGLGGLKRLTLERCAGLRVLDGLGDFEGLEEVSFQGCRSLEEIEGLASHEGLRRVNLSGCEVVASIEPLRGLDALEWLDLYYCHGLAELGALEGKTKLAWLNLCHCKGALERLDGIASLSALTYLDLSFSDVLRDADVLRGLHALEYLDLKYCEGLRDAQGLRELTALRVLKLDGRHLGDVSFLAPLVELETLEINAASRFESSEALRALGRLDKLERLALHGCKNLRDLDVCARLSTTVTSLEIDGAYQLRKIDALAAMGQLTRLTLRDGSRLPAAALDHLSGLETLERADLYGWRALSGTEALRGLGALEVLELGGSAVVDLKGLAPLARLRDLGLSNTPIRDLSPVASLEGLHEINLSHCQELRHVDALRDATQLRRVHLYNCRRLRNVWGLAELPNLYELNLEVQERLLAPPEEESMRSRAAVTAYQASLRAHPRVEPVDELRAVLASPPSAEVWAQVEAYFGDWLPGESPHVRGLEVATEALEAWEDGLRVGTLKHYFHQETRLTHPCPSLVRHLRLETSWVKMERLHEATSPFSEVTILSIDGQDTSGMEDIDELRAFREALRALYAVVAARAPALRHVTIRVAGWMHGEDLEVLEETRSLEGTWAATSRLYDWEEVLARHRREEP